MKGPQKPRAARKPVRVPVVWLTVPHTFSPRFRGGTQCKLWGCWGYADDRNHLASPIYTVHQADPPTGLQRVATRHDA